MIRISRVTDPKDIAACLALRRAVFIIEQGVSEAEEVDGLDGQCLHILAREGERAVGAARIKLIGETAKIQRVCVALSHRGTGLGAELMTATLKEARTLPKVTRALLGSQLQAIGFYERLGFIAEGPVYDDAGIPHRDMVLVL